MAKLSRSLAVTALVAPLAFGASSAVAKPAPPPVPSAPPPPGAVAPPVASAETCYQLSPSASVWSRSPDLLCVSSGATGDQVSVTLRAGFPPAAVVAMPFTVKTRVRCLDCNRDTLALIAPDGSVFNQLTIVFNGKRNLKTGEEAGSLKLFGRTLNYRRSGTKPSVGKPPVGKPPGGKPATGPDPLDLTPPPRPTR